MRSVVRRVGSVLVVVLAVQWAAPQAGEAARVDRAPADGPIMLRSATLHGPADQAGLPPRLRFERGALAHGGPALLRLREPLDPDRRARFAARSIGLAGHLGDGAVIAWLPEGGLSLAESLPGVEWAAPYHPGLRISPALSALRDDGTVASLPITVHLFAHAEVTVVAARLRELGLAPSGLAPGRERQAESAYTPGRIVLKASTAQWTKYGERIAAWPEVLWIDRRPVYRLLNDASAWVGQSGLFAGQATTIYDRGIYGEGQTIGILDTGIDADMCFFRDALLGLPPSNTGLGAGSPDEDQRKVTIVNFLWSEDDPANDGDWDSHDHGTHVAGSVAGDHPAHPGQRDAGDGMAPAAKLVIQDGGFGIDDCADMPAIGCPAADLYPFFEQAYLQGARIHSNSYGDRENALPRNIYSEGSQAADAFMWDHPDMLLVFAAGNSGTALDSVLSPATGKNVLAVGATQHGSGAGSIASFSSRGMTHDGRIKPDLTAPGVSIISADNDHSIFSNNCATRSMSGTSMAAPTAAGLAALVAEYYAKGFYPDGRATPGDALSPTSALLKATLIASTVPMENESAAPPSATQGWGRILLDDALYFAGDARRLFAIDERKGFHAETAADDLYSLTVLDPSLPLRVVLVWTDYPSTPAASVNLVNDLDLEVESPSGALYLGNVFVNGQSVTGGSADTVNNVEAFRLDSPQAGGWTVRVIPRTISEAAQGYALVATGGVAAPGVRLERTGLVVDDAVGGNGDGLLDTGEWADLHVELYNAGDTAATNVAVDVESLSANLVVHQPGAALPDLDSGQSGTTQSPHPRIRLATSHTCAEPVDLQFSYAADGHARGESTTLSTGCQIYDPVPNPVQTLRLNLDASDVVLGWLRPGLDPAHGEADRYRVYRSTMPDSGWTLAVELHDSAEELSHSDPDGAGGAELVFYQVIAGNDAGDAEALP